MVRGPQTVMGTADNSFSLSFSALAGVGTEKEEE
jgi:hypothetical protein